MSTRQTADEKRWKSVLMPFANDYSAMMDTIVRHCEALTDDELAQLLNDASSPTPTNCWWAVYAVGAVIAEQVKSEQYRRAATAARLSSVSQP